MRKQRTKKKEAGSSSLFFIINYKLFLFGNYDLLHHIILPDLIDHIKAFIYLTKYSVIAIQVFGVLSAMTNKELSTPRVSSAMRHAQYTTVVILIFTVQLTIDLVTRASIADAVGTTTLNNKIGDHAVKSKAIIKTFFSQVCKIFNGIGCVLFKELHLHYTLIGVDFSYFHAQLLVCLNLAPKIFKMRQGNE